MKISIILPCYNEEKNIKKTVHTMMSYIRNIKNIDFEILLVNDGSTDNTLQECITAASNNNNIKTISYAQNSGKGFAVKTGILNSTGDYIIFMDTDLSTDLSAINQTLSLIDEYSVIIGSRRHNNSVITKPQPLHRRFVGVCCSYLTNLILPLKQKDTQCGFKCFKRDIALLLVNKQKKNKFSFDVEYLYICHLYKIPIKTIPVTWENDPDSSVSTFKTSISFFKNLFEIRCSKKHYLTEVTHIENNK